MGSSIEPPGPTLFVEGRDDLYSIGELLARHGIQRGADKVANIEESKTVEKLLEAIVTRVKVGGEFPIGFVLDADSPVIDRWRSVRDRLLKGQVEDVPESPSAEGFIGRSSEWQTKVGVWLMPDNLSDGMLEDFLQRLLADNDTLIRFARTATEDSIAHGAKYSPVHRSKAVIHAWLAWQAKPGEPFGTAIHAKYFRHDTEIALRFVAWYRTLFEIV